MKVTYMYVCPTGKSKRRKNGDKLSKKIWKRKEISIAVWSLIKSSRKKISLHVVKLIYKILVIFVLFNINSFSSFEKT